LPRYRHSVELCYDHRGIDGQLQRVNPLLQQVP